MNEQINIDYIPVSSNHAAIYWVWETSIVLYTVLIWYLIQIGLAICFFFPPTGAQATV